MKKLAFISLLIFLSVIYGSYAQTPFICGMDGSGPISSPITIIPSCVEQLPCENAQDIYYIPDGSSVNNNDELTIRLVLHVMQKSDGTGNFQDTPADRYFLLHHYNSWVNWKLSGTTPPVYSGQSFSNPSPGNSKLKVELLEEDIHFWQDDLGWNNSGPGNPGVACGFGSYVWDTYRVDEDCKMNVFLI